MGRDLQRSSYVMCLVIFLKNGTVLAENTSLDKSSRTRSPLQRDMEIALENRGVLLFVDNWPIIECHILGTARLKNWLKLWLRIDHTDFEVPPRIWAARVPSELSIADPLSCGSLEPLHFLGEILMKSPNVRSSRLL